MSARRRWWRYAIGALALGVSSCNGCQPRPPTPQPVGCIAARSDAVAPAGCPADDGEPNGDLVLATAPAQGATCAATTRTGTIAGDNDVDVVRTGPCALSSHDPSATLAAVDAVSSVDALRLCLFVACQFGTTNVYGCYQHTAGDSVAVDGGTPATWKTRSEGGFSGCCRYGGGPVSVQVECGGLTSQQIEGFVWVDAGAQPLATNLCPAYQTTYQMN